MMKTYSDLIKIKSYEERYRYLKLGGGIGIPTFGYDRWINQSFYHKDPRWIEARNRAILRDSNGDYVLDLAHPDHPILGKVLVHHINPITKQDLLEQSIKLFDLDNLICVSLNTHNAIHYGNETLLEQPMVIRSPYDTCPWRK